MPWRFIAELRQRENSLKLPQTRQAPPEESGASLARPGLARSLREADAAEQILEARIRVQGLPYWVHVQEGEQCIVLLIGFFQPVEGLILVSQARVNACH